MRGSDSEAQAISKAFGKMNAARALIEWAQLLISTKPSIGFSASRQSELRQALTKNWNEKKFDVMRITQEYLGSDSDKVDMTSLSDSVFTGWLHAVIDFGNQYDVDYGGASTTSAPPGEPPTATRNESADSDPPAQTVDLNKLIQTTTGNKAKQMLTTWGVELPTGSKLYEYLGYKDERVYNPMAASMRQFFGVPGSVNSLDQGKLQDAFTVAQWSAHLTPILESPVAAIKAELKAATEPKKETDPEKEIRIPAPPEKAGTGSEVKKVSSGLWPLLAGALAVHTLGNGDSDSGVGGNASLLMAPLGALGSYAAKKSQDREQDRRNAEEAFNYEAEHPEVIEQRKSLRWRKRGERWGSIAFWLALAFFLVTAWVGSLDYLGIVAKVATLIAFLLGWFIALVVGQGVASVIRFVKNKVNRARDNAGSILLEYNINLTNEDGGRPLSATERSNLNKWVSRGPLISDQHAREGVEKMLVDCHIDSDPTKPFKFRYDQSATWPKWLRRG